MNSISTDANLGIWPVPGLLPNTEGTIWTKAAGRTLREDYRTADDANGWARWQKHLAKRRQPKCIDSQFPGRHSPLTWALPDEAAGSPTSGLIERIAGAVAQASAGELPENLVAEIERWLWSVGGAERTSLFALESLALAHALPALSAALPAEKWWRLLGALNALAETGDRTDLIADPLANQLLAGELPLTLAYQFPELSACSDLQPAGRSALARGMAELLDGEGLPQSTYLPIFRPLLACWTRARALGGKHAWDLETETQYRLTVQEAIRLARRDGRQALSTGEAGTWSAKLFKLAVKLSRKKQVAQLAERMLPGGKATGDKPATAPAVHSDWAELAILQPAWRRGGPKVTLAYSDRQPRIELEIAGQIIWSGPWDLSVKVGGEPAELTSNWEEVCWVSDEDVDYVEIEAKLSGGFKSQRQVLLSRKDNCLLLADAVLGPEPHDLDYASGLPLAAEVSFEPANETREGWLQTAKTKLPVLPLALPEWRCDGRPGQLLADGNRLQLRQQGRGKTLYAPLLIDLDAKRAAKGVTWRQLTVAELRENQPADVAVGYRAQAGSAQWLIYRSLGRPGVRTVLGQNLSTEFLFGRFRSTGDVQRQIEIEVD